MRKFLISFFALFWLGAAPAQAEDVLVSELLGEMKDALLRVQQAADADQLPPLKEARLNLSTVHKRDAGGTIKFLIFEFGKKRTNEITSTLSIALAPPSPTASSNVSDPDISQLLADTILATARSLEVASRGQPPLDAKEVKATIKFGVTRETSGKLKIEFLPAEIEGGGSGSRADVQEIVITYALPG